MLASIGLFCVNSCYFIKYLYLYCTVFLSGFILPEFVPYLLYKFDKMEHFNTL